MQALTEKILEQQLGERVLNDVQLARILGGSDARRYGSVNRALRAGELQHVKRGLYLLPPRFRHDPVHPFALAQALLPTSYVSFESALSYHGWIPEAVYTSASVTPERKSRRYELEALGCFTFQPLAIQPGYFLEQVERLQLTGQTLLLAKPLRALMDWVCLRKLAWQGLDVLLDGMRLDEDLLHQLDSSVTAADISALAQVYKHQRVRDYLQHFARELGIAQELA